MRSLGWLLGLAWRKGRALARRFQERRAIRRVGLSGPPEAPYWAWYWGDDLTCRACGAYASMAGQLGACPACGFQGGVKHGGGWADLTPAELEILRELAKAYAASFCGECHAGPDRPQGRCPACLERLAAVLEREKARPSP